jgi:hypothetical protein
MSGLQKLNYQFGLNKIERNNHGTTANRNKG